MDFDPELVGWLSATDSLETLYNWFTREDILKLQEKGWFVHEFEAEDAKLYERFQHIIINQETSKVTKKIVLKETIAEKALRLLSSVPSDDFITGAFSNRENTKCCALGHYNRLRSNDPSDYSYGNCVGGANLNEAVRNLFIKEGSHIVLLTINDSSNIAKYPQSTPKERVIACLQDMVAAGY
jgi:hypothetical protein